MVRYRSQRTNKPSPRIVDEDVDEDLAEEEEREEVADE